MTKNKGFTLVELLIVIGILAVLSTATVLILNPAQILQETRDAQRLNDVGSISSALSLLLATNTAPNLQGGAGFACGTNFGASVAGATENFTGIPVLAHAGVRANDGTGWVAAVLTGVSGGSPLAVLPVDPTNTTVLNYQYACDQTNKYFEVDATDMESTKYDPYATNDGGDQAAVYEVGNRLSL
ncbi:MAG: prepilin-type N-terminal cleavage/methylation domain-containing protein [Candidatus Andersenbacteria bacterium]|nr:prepilin-type N-terminal cleavage/methylation domain-containing protein [Candidatus Andersenbacteria bacterium]